MARYALFTWYNGKGDRYHFERELSAEEAKAAQDVKPYPAMINYKGRSEADPDIPVEEVAWKIDVGEKYTDGIIAYDKIDRIFSNKAALIKIQQLLHI